MLSSPGIGSGLDVQGIVSQLIQVEQRPILRNSERTVELQAALSGYGKLSSAMAEFQSAMQKLSSSDEFRIFSATSSDEDVVKASASSDAARGVFDVDVQRLAENHRMVAGTAFADTDATEVGTTGDTMTIAVGGGVLEIDLEGLTLGAVRDAINDASNNPGVTATIVTDDTGNYLTLTGGETGSDNFVTVTFGGADPFSFENLNVDRDGDAAFTAADLDAVVVLENRFTVTSNRNSIADAVTGLTLDLESVGTSTVRIDRDTAAVGDNVRSFVSAYNGVVSTIDELKGGVLEGDTSTLAFIESQLRSVLLEGVGVEGAVYSQLFEIGISTTREGTLEVENDSLNRALEGNFEDVATLFSAPERGYALRFDSLADDFLSASGIFSSREDSLGNQIDILKDRKIELERRLALKEARLFAQFSQLDGLLASLNATSDYLTQQLDNLPQIGQSNN